MGRRRLQKTGNLFRDGRWWRLRWWEDALDAAGNVARRRPSAIIGPCEGPGKLTERAASRKAWDDILSKIDAYNACPQSVVTLQQFVSQKFEPEVVWSLKHSGKLHYGYCLGKILPACGSKPLREVKAADIQALVRKLIDAGYSTQTATHVRNAFSAVFSHAKRVGFYSGENPASLVRLPQMQRAERSALSWTQAQDALRALPSPVKEMALLSMSTSLNVAELCGLRRKWVNLSAGFVMTAGEALPPFSIAVRENYYRNRYGTTKTGSRRRIVPIPEAVMPFLAGLLARPKFNGPDDPVFASSAGTPIDAHNTNNRLFRKVAKGIGAKLTWHVFRHSCATFAEAVGMAKSDRMALMGHGAGAMTDHYTHSDIERRRTSVNEIAGRLLPTEPGVVQ